MTAERGAREEEGGGDERVEHRRRERGHDLDDRLEPAGPGARAAEEDSDGNGPEDREGERAGRPEPRRAEGEAEDAPLARRDPGEEAAETHGAPESGRGRENAAEECRRSPQDTGPGGRPLPAGRRAPRPAPAPPPARAGGSGESSAGGASARGARRPTTSAAPRSRSPPRGTSGTRRRAASRGAGRPRRSSPSSRRPPRPWRACLPARWRRPCTSRPRQAEVPPSEDERLVDGQEEPSARHRHHRVPDEPDDGRRELDRPERLPAREAVQARHLVQLRRERALSEP